jgi:hypothetical protein
MTGIDVRMNPLDTANGVTVTAVNLSFRNVLALWFKISVASTIIWGPVYLALLFGMRVLGAYQVLD